MNAYGISFAEFELQVREALTQLYHPGYRPPPLLFSILAVAGQPGAERVREALLQAIEALKPSPDTPPNARSWRLHYVLVHRYVEARTQEETAELLSITPRHLRREQHEAVQVLARQLWERCPVNPLIPVEDACRDEGVAWRSQVQQELAALQKTTPGAVADVAAVIAGALTVGQPLAARHGVTLATALAEANLLVALHPSALRQVLVTALEKLAQQMTHGQILFAAEQVNGEIQITILADPVTAGPMPASALIDEILTAQGGTFGIQRNGSRLCCQVNLPAVAPLTVLVVDDNTDLVHFYQRFVANTRYQIVHAAEGESVLPLIEEVRPAVIVLDVMLPDMDGWELLATLRNHPTAGAIPVIVCSVVRREELASVLQAARYVAKPVRRQNFIEALDQVLAPALPTPTPAPAHSATAC
jgi:CheY-like chemotaxis protein